MALTQYHGPLDSNARRVVILSELLNATTGAALKTKLDALSGFGLISDAERAKLTAVEADATGDLTGAEIVALIQGVTGSEVLTTDEKSKLSGLEEGKFKGRFTEADFPAALAALEVAYPTPAAGSIAEISDGSTVKSAIHDGTDWVEDPASVPGETSASIKTKYEANADTNALSDANKAKVDALKAVVNTLVSDATDAPLSAAQGKALKALIDDASGVVVTAIPTDGAATVFPVNHGVTGRKVISFVRKVADGEQVGTGLTEDFTGNATVTFGYAPTPATFELVTAG